MPTKTITLIPAYGREYDTERQAVSDFEKGRDWVIASIHPYQGAYCSIRDLDGYDVTLRYNYNRDSVVVKR
jgi:hypothetical protein